MFVEDHQVFHECMRHVFNQQSDISMVGAFADGREAIKKVAPLKPHVVVMDITMPRLNGIDATRIILKQHPDVKVVALSNHAERQLVENMLKAGARGYVLKSDAFDDLVNAIRQVVSGVLYLSPGLNLTSAGAMCVESEIFSKLTRREREVLQLIGRGVNTREIAEELNISPKTVESHRVNLMKKLNVSNPVELALFAIREGVSPL